MNARYQINNFRNMTQPDAEKLLSSLSLSMPLSTLAFCMQYYRDVALRDPYTDELFMLDRIAVALAHSPCAYAPIDLVTEDDFAAETYADLLSKRRTLNPHAKHPCTFLEAAYLASAALARAGRTPGVWRDASLLPEHVRDTRYAPSDTCVKAADSPFRLRVLPALHAKAETDDLLLLLTPGKGQTRRRFYRESEELLSKKELGHCISGVYTVQKGGLLTTLLEISDSLLISMSAFSSLPTPLPMTVLTDHFGACRILRVSKDAEGILAKMFADTTLSSTVFAKVTKDANYTFLRQNEAPVILQSRFLRLLYSCKGIPVRLSSERNLHPDPIACRAVSDQSCRYLSKEVTGAPSDTVLIRGVVSATASASMAHAFYKTALYTTLSPIMALAACGVERKDAHLTFGVEYPLGFHEPVLCGELLSTLLGIYRAVCECSIPAESVTLRQNTLKHPSVTAFALAQASPVASVYQGEGHKIYYLAPTFCENGLPDFSSLRALLDKLSKLSKSGAILSSSIICTESITDVLARKKDIYSCRITNTALACQGSCPLGILIESDRVLDEIEVGVTERVFSEKVQDETDHDEKTSSESLIWSARPEIVLVARREDSDADALSCYLLRRSAAVHRYTDTEAESDPLSRALLGAQVLILCPGAQLSGNPRLDFALSTMRAANGRLIYLGSPETAPEGFEVQSNGLSDALLGKICPHEKKNPKKS